MASQLTENIDYSTTGRKSVWGAGDPDTLRFLESESIRGRWLNLAAGDGRYNQQLLAKADYVVASDVDGSALQKLCATTPTKYKQKLEVKAFDVTKKFPFDNQSFEGILCTGTLHLFPRKTLEKIVKEIDRVLKSNGKVIIDFATDVKRVLPNGELYVRAGESQYTTQEAKSCLEELFKDYKITIKESSVPEETIKSGDKQYQFSCNFLLLTAVKP